MHTVRALKTDEVTTILACLTKLEETQLPGLKLTMRFLDDPSTIAQIRGVIHLCKTSVFVADPSAMKKLENMFSVRKVVPNWDISLTLGETVTFEKLDKWKHSVFSRLTKLQVN